MSTTPRDASPEVLPEPDLVRLGPLVAWGWMEVGGRREVYVWHWCDHSGWRSRAAREGWTPDEEAMRPAWEPAGVGAHDLISTDPLHLEPSVYWPDCCGMHGWIRDGRWAGA